MIKTTLFSGLFESRDSEGNLVISDYKWRKLFPQQVEINVKAK